MKRMWHLLRSASQYYHLNLWIVSYSMKFLCLTLLSSGKVINMGNKFSKGCNPIGWLNNQNHKKLNAANLLQDVGKIIYQIFSSTNSIDLVNSTRTYKLIKLKSFTEVHYPWQKSVTNGKLKKPLCYSPNISSLPIQNWIFPFYKKW